MTLAAQSSPGWGRVEGEGGGRRRRALRLLGLDRHRTGSWEGAHVRGDLCVWCLEAGVRVSRGHRSVLLCVWGCITRIEWCVRVGHTDIGTLLSRQGVCVSVLRVQGCVEKVMS